MWHLLTSALLVFGAVDVELQALDGTKTRGRVAAWNADQIVLQSDSGTTTQQCQQLLEVRSISDTVEQADEDKPVIWVDLADGSVLVASAFSATGGNANITLRDKSAITLPTRQIACVRLTKLDGPLSKQWQQIRNIKAAADVVVIRKKDALDYFEGIIDEVTDEKVIFTYEGKDVSVARSKVDGFIYFGGVSDPLPEVVCRLDCTDGTKLNAKSIEFKDGKLQVKTLLDLVLSVPIERMDRVDYSFGKIEYLSDLKPEHQRWTPYIGFPPGLEGMQAIGNPRRDEALDGRPLQLGDKVYAKGLAVRSRSELTYRLPAKKYKRFLATVGLDDEVGDGGNVKLIISGDGRQLLEIVISGSDPPKDIEVDISEVRKLTIVVDYGNDLDVADHLNLCEARITK